MGFLIEQFWLLLVLGFVLGVVVGWLLRHWQCLAAHSDLETRLREVSSAVTTPIPLAAVAAVQASTREPKGYPIEEVEGIGAGFGRKLRALGITTTLEMLDRAAIEAQRDELAEAIGDRSVDARVVNRWASMCDLMRVPGVRGQYAELLEFSSINSVQELSEQEAAALRERLAEVNEREKRVRHLPSQKDVTDWIASASQLPVRLTPAGDLVAREALAGLTDYPIEEVEGIGKGFGAGLREQGIATTGDLLGKGRSTQGLRMMAERLAQPQVDAEVISTWVSMSDLMRVNGVRGQYAELLYFSGIKSVDELADSRANDLLDRLKETEERENRVPELPGIDEVAEWVEGARRIR